jgi:hypothetical protein
MEPYAEVDYNSPYPIVNFVVCYPLPLHKERGGVGKISLLVEHIYIYLIISKTTNRKRESMGRDGVRADLTVCLLINFLWSMRKTMPELTLIPHCSWLKLP